MPIENKDIFSKNLKYYMDKKGVDRNQLCADLDLKYTTVRDWIKGITYPRIGKIELLANYFGINKSDLIEEKSTITSSIPFQNFDPRQAILLSNYSKLNDTRKNKLLATSETLLAEEQGKIIDISEKRAEYDARKRISLSVPGKVSAGTGYWQEDDYDTMVDFYADEIPDKSKYDTVAVVVGHSMEPKIKNGDFLFIKLKDQVDLNKIGIFQVDGENYVKKLKSNCLQSLNPDYNDIQFTENMRTIGEVVEVYREK
ncbi:TPA: helix-turn-helix transcriptional regulator [Streptococcus suis]|uniref:XRE family transcriptional regulator n=1 Tax=Streptococcus suis TaxID=1307 RepID=UPI0005CCBC71|nr:XRE family transcriptional regulator [Streptococcus suis]QBX30729.1 repressor [Streptococcus phage Javan566]NQG82951.1 helix-turn-helix transcriptional regulator [Streptococcus suis]NQI28708.1 helix-turn-helix transcriptional regulator [Streptococcus suis]NQQ52517.1 helix-turn-helix transcriptional regulator [Streptococcus suis]NQQ78757.1 helix-turn-helix transcriptional regulator [Streptococcus suis]